jgi:hypothetical protein
VGPQSARQARPIARQSEKRSLNPGLRYLGEAMKAPARTSIEDEHQDRIGSCEFAIDVRGAGLWPAHSVPTIRERSEPQVITGGSWGDTHAQTQVEGRFQGGEALRECGELPIDPSSRCEAHRREVERRYPQARPQCGPFIGCNSNDPGSELPGNAPRDELRPGGSAETYEEVTT